MSRSAEPDPLFSNPRLAAIYDAFVVAGFTVQDVRAAPDRPGKEWVFVAMANGPDQGGETNG